MDDDGGYPYHHLPCDFYGAEQAERVGNGGIQSIAMNHQAPFPTFSTSKFFLVFFLWFFELDL